MSTKRKLCSNWVKNIKLKVSVLKMRTHINPSNLRKKRSLTKSKRHLRSLTCHLFHKTKKFQNYHQQNLPL